MCIGYRSFLIALMCLAGGSALAYTCETVTSSTTIQPKDFAIQRDLPVGSVIGEVASDIVSTFKCSNTEPKLPWQEVGIKAYGTYVADFDGKRVYKTNVDGIGYAVGISTPGGTWDACANVTRWVTGSNTDNPNHYVYCAVNGMFSALPRQGKALVRFYKTAATIGAGSVSGKQVGSFILRNNKTSWHTPESAINIGAFKVDVMSCTVSSKLIPVKLGDVPISAFKGPGTSPPGRTQAFNIPLNCSKGTSINLRLDGTAHDAAQGMLKLDAAATSATGVAIQLLYDDKPLELAKLFKWQVADTDGDYAIPLKARYVQTDNSIVPGVANGSATFTLTYQ